MDNEQRAGPLAASLASQTAHSRVFFLFFMFRGSIQHLVRNSQFFGPGPKYCFYVRQGVSYTFFSIKNEFCVFVRKLSPNFSPDTSQLFLFFFLRVLAVFPLQPIAVLRPAGLHWSAELRRQATASARERSKVESEMEAGSARCTPLPPKVSTVFFFCRPRPL